MSFGPSLPTRRGFRPAGAERAFLPVRLVRIAYDYALIPGFADVTDRGAAEEGEVQERFVIEVAAPAENAFFGFGNLRRGIIHQDELAISTAERSPGPFESEAVS
jgi:hypothetical protein